MNQPASAPAAPSSLRRGVVWTAIGNASYLASQYGMLMAIAKLGNTTLVGQFSLSLAIIAPVMVLSQMHLRQVFVTDAQQSVPYGAYFWTRALTGLLALAGIVALVALLGYDRRFQIVTALLAIAKLAESQSDIVYASLQRRERMDLVAGSMMLRGLTGLTALALCLWQTGTLVGASLALAGTWVLGFAALDLNLMRLERSPDRLHWHWDAPTMWHLVRISAPLTVAAGLVSLSASLPRYFLDYFQGKAAVALFAVAMTPISLMGIFTGAISQATLARASVYLQTGKFAAFEALGRKLVALNVLVGVVLVTLLLAAGRPLVSLFFTPEYESAVPAMVVLGAGVALSGLAAYGSMILSAGRRFRLQLNNVIVALLCQVPLCLIAVPRLGAIGAGWAEFGKFTATTIFLHLVGRRAYRALRQYSEATSQC